MYNYTVRSVTYFYMPKNNTYTTWLGDSPMPSQLCCQQGGAQSVDLNGEIWRSEHSLGRNLRGRIERHASCMQQDGERTGDQVYSRCRIGRVLSLSFGGPGPGLGSHVSTSTSKQKTDRITLLSKQTIRLKLNHTI